MATFEVQPATLKTQAETLKNAAAAIKKQSEEISNIRSSIHISNQVDASLRRQLSAISSLLNTQGNTVRVMGSKLEQASQFYAAAEQAISGATPASSAQGSSTGGSVGGGYSSGGDNNSSNGNNSSSSIFKVSTSGAAIAGTATTSGKILGVETGGSASGELGGYSAEVKFIGPQYKKKQDDKTGKWESDTLSLMEAKGSAEVHAAKGKLEGNVGIASGSVEGSAGNIAATGSVAATLYKDGKLSPQLSGKAKAEVSALEGSANGQLGSNENNLHGKVEGSVLTASAGAEAGIGKVSYTDKSGNVTTGYGVSGKVKAEAYAVEGTASGGFSIMGIKLDASVTGKAGGLGASAGVAATKGSVKASAGIGAVLGLEIGIGIDWSGFKNPFKK